MRIAIFSDTHGNALALEAMIEHAEAIGVEQYLCLGDLVGYYMRPRDVVRRVRKLPGWAIQGNHERFLRDVLDGRRDLEQLTERYGEGHRIALEELAAADLEWLVGLPAERDIVIDGLSIRLCHGAPGEPDRYVYPDTGLDALRELCDEAQDFVFSGHTHYPFVFTHRGCSLVNVGSVGQSKDIGGLATWGLLDTNNRTFVQLRTPYDLVELKREIASRPNRNEGYLLSVLGRHRYDGVRQ